MSRDIDKNLIMEVFGVERDQITYVWAGKAYRWLYRGHECAAQWHNDGIVHRWYKTSEGTPKTTSTGLTLAGDGPRRPLLIKPRWKYLGAQTWTEMLEWTKKLLDEQEPIA